MIVHLLKILVFSLYTVYWDGDLRRVFKAATDEKRQQQQPEEWSNLQMFCLNGIMLSVSNACELDGLFPKCRLFKAEIMETMSHCRIPQVNCTEEADAEIAQAAAGNENAFVLGEDSDFCFFRNVNYIPMSTLHASGNVQLATAVVLRRDELAHELELPDEDAMVELAILMGNDYVDRQHCSGALMGDGTAIDFVREQGAGFRVTGKSDASKEALRFVRALYQLEPLDEFELYDPRNESNAVDEDVDVAGDTIVDPNPSVPKAYRPSVPKEIRVELLTIDIRVDGSLKDAVMRCLQAYVNRMESTETGNPMLTQTHVDVFKHMTSPPPTVASEKDWRPDWTDIPAAYLIEKMIVLAMEQKSPLAHAARPSTIFDQQVFLERTNDLRLSEALAREKEAKPRTVFAPEGSFDKGERHKLPIDDHEEKILEAIAKNRVTIIKGETGCGKSSRIPVMLMNAPPPDPALSQVKLFISQVRRWILMNTLVFPSHSHLLRNTSQDALQPRVWWNEFARLNRN